MPLNQFLSQTCTIFEKQVDNSGIEPIVTIVDIYTNIPCYYYKKGSSSWNISDTKLASNTNLNEYKVMLEPSRINVRQWMSITITDPDIWDIWTYKIEDVKVNRLIDNSLDSIELLTKATNAS